MIEYLFEVFIFIFVEGAFLPSDKNSSPSKKIWHAIFRTGIYLGLVGLFVYLTLTMSGITRILTFIFSGIFLFLMIRPNWISFKRHQEWLQAKNASID